MSQTIIQVWRKADRWFVWLSGMLIGIGLFVFVSGALSLFARNTDIFWGTILRHIGLGIGGGVVCGLCVLAMPVKTLRSIAPWLFVATIVLTALVFTPLGIHHGGATRWIELGGIVTIQPGEFLKIGAILFGAGLFTRFRSHVSTWRGLAMFISIIAIVGAVLLLQPDTDTFLAIAVSVFGMYFVSGARVSHMLALGICAVLGAWILVMSRPYLMDRFTTFLHPDRDPLGSSYHVQQSLLAIGSGELFGRGYGQGVQKIQSLPEPMGDAIFAVVGEEFGFVGTTIIVLMFAAWSGRVFVLARQHDFLFPKLVIVGCGVLITSQALLNILSNLGLFPFSGLPLPFMSQGGSSLLVVLVACALIVRCLSVRGYVES